MGASAISVAGSRQPSLVPRGAPAAPAARPPPGAPPGRRGGARRAVVAALDPLERVAAETRAIGPAELGKRIASPTGQAEVTELADSINRMLERVDRAHRALEAFTADASHELRTPLTHLRAQVQWASAEERSEPQMREALMAMERELERTTKLVDELLLIARGENRQLALAHVPFDLRMVVDEVKEITEAMGGALDRALAVRVEPSEAVWALGDSDRTRHILLNLASNAVRYTPGGSITFALRRNGAVVGASVRDTGPGIAPEHVERIFDRFFRIDQSRSRELGGRSEEHTSELQSRLHLV